MKNLSDRYAVITGANQGIGKAIARKILDEGAAGVAMIDIDYDQVCQTAQAIDPSGTRALPVACDITDRQRVKFTIENILNHFKTIDILVNNAGIIKDKMFHKMTDEIWDAVINVNLNGTYNITHLVVPIMRDKEYGRIINLSSIACMGNVGQANYSATKAALQGFSRTLARECGPKNITVNCVAPSFVNTAMAAATPPEKVKQIVSQIPLGRMCEPEEVASVVAFLASDEASYVSAQTIYLQGGQFGL